MPPQRIDMRELVKRVQARTGLGPAALARLTGVSRPVLSRILNESPLNTGKTWSHGIAFYEFAKKLGVEIPRLPE